MKEKASRFLKRNFGEDFFGFISHSKNYVSSDLFSKGLAFVSIPIFTRLLVPQEYGVLAIFTSFVSIFSIVAGLGVRGAVTRYYFEKTDDFDQYYGSIVLFVLGWGLVVSLSLFLLSGWLVKFFQIPVNVIYLGIGAVFSSVFLNILLAYLRASMQSGKIARINIIKSIVFLAISIVITLMLKEKRYYGKAWGRLIVEFGLFCYAIFYIFKISRVRFNFRYIKYSMVFGIPIVFHLLSAYVLKSFDQVIINQLIGNRETGLYSFAYRIGMIQNIITMGALKAWQPIFYDKMNNRKYPDIERLARKYSILVYLLALVLVLFSREIVMLMADPEYYASLEVVPVVVISFVFLFLYTMYVNYCHYYKKTYLIAIITVVAGGINIGLNYLLIPRFGYLAAAWTTLISYFFLFVFHFLNVKYLIKPERITSLKVLLPNLGKIILLILIYYYVRTFIDSMWIMVVVKLVLVAAGVLVLFTRQIRRLLIR